MERAATVGNHQDGVPHHAQVTLENAIQADETSILMGDKVEPRREFIEKNAKYVRNLDI
jgi:DNA gyrase/topoisomerase IV subunit B